MNRITRRLRERRNAREFSRALEFASPAMKQELIAASMRSPQRFQ